MRKLKLQVQMTVDGYIAGINGEMDFIVWNWDNTVLAKGNLVDEITKLKKQDGKDIIAYGGATFVSALIKQGLIDEFHLFINPTAIGNGMTIFQELDSKQNLTLVKSTSFDCGIVVSNYEPKRD